MTEAVLPGGKGIGPGDAASLVPGSLISSTYISRSAFPICIIRGEVYKLWILNVSAVIKILHKQKAFFVNYIEPRPRKILKCFFLMLVDFLKFSKITFFK